MKPGFWTRLKQAKIVQVLLVYAGASWAVLEVAGVFIEQFGLPGWFFQATILLLLIGLVILVTTAWVQMRAAGSQAPASLPTPFEVDVVDIKESVARGRLPHLTWARAALAGVIAVSLLFGFAGIFVLLNPPAADTGGPTAHASVAPGVAVLPFRAVGPEMEFWREGLVDLLAPNLDGVAGLRAVDPRNVLSRWRRAFGQGGDAPDRGAALAVAEESGASFAVIGSAVELGGGTVRLAAEVFDAGSRESLGAAQVEGPADSILTLVDDLSVELLQTRILQAGTAIPRLDLGALTTHSLPALRAYLEGEQHYRRGKWRAAHDSYSRAIAEDSAFALALYRLNLADGWASGDPATRNTEAALRAAGLGENLPERVRLLLQGNAQLNLDDPRCIETLTRLVERYPDDVEAWYLLGESYLHVGSAHRQPPRSYRDALTRALSLDPDYGPAYIHLIEDAMIDGDSARMRQLLDRYLSFGSSGPVAAAYRLAYAMTWGGDSARESALAALDTASSDVLMAGMWSLASSPHTYEVAGSVGDELLDADRSLSARAMGHAMLFLTNELRGKADSAQNHLAAALLLSGPYDSATANTWSVVQLYVLDLIDSGPPAREVALAPYRPFSHFYAGAYAARQGDWDEEERHLTELQAGARSAAEGGDEKAQQEYEGYAWALGIYAAIHRGDLEAASRRYEDYRSGATEIEHQLLAYELGKLAFAEGDFEFASDIFMGLSYAPGPLMSLAYLRLAEALEAVGEPDEARQVYARFLEWYDEPDAHLEPLRDRARQSLARLSQEPRS